MSPMSLLTLPPSTLQGHVQHGEPVSTHGAPAERLLAGAVFAAITVAAVLACLL